MLRPRRPGFTLIELLVVIAIMAILIALLLPAVQQAREAARRSACKNNLHQLGIALTNYYDAFERLPPGVVNPTGPIRNEPNGYHFSWLVQILPQLDQGVLAKKFDALQSVYDPVNLPPRQFRLSILFCPSDPATAYLSVPPLGSVALNNYAGCLGGDAAPIDVNNRGVLFLNSSIQYSAITDGLAHTLALGEMKRSEFDLGWASGTRGTLRNAGTRMNLTPGGNVYADASGDEAVPVENALDPGGFGSYHVGGCQFLLADGSSRFISENINESLYRRLADRADGVRTRENEF